MSKMEEIEDLTPMQLIDLHRKVQVAIDLLVDAYPSKSRDRESLYLNDIICRLQLSRVGIKMRLENAGFNLQGK